MKKIYKKINISKDLGSHKNEKKYFIINWGPVLYSKHLHIFNIREKSLNIFQSLSR